MSFVFYFVYIQIIVSGLCAMVTVISSWKRMNNSHIFIPIFMMQFGDFIWAIGNIVQSIINKFYPGNCDFTGFLEYYGQITSISFSSIITLAFILTVSDIDPRKQRIYILIIAFLIFSFTVISDIIFASIHKFAILNPDFDYNCWVTGTYQPGNIIFYIILSSSLVLNIFSISAFYIKFRKAENWLEIRKQLILFLLYPLIQLYCFGTATVLLFVGFSGKVPDKIISYLCFITFTQYGMLNFFCFGFHIFKNSMKQKSETKSKSQILQEIQQNTSESSNTSESQSELSIRSKSSISSILE